MNTRSHLFAHMRANRARKSEVLDRLAQADREACGVNRLAASRGMKPSHPHASNYQECLDEYKLVSATRVERHRDWKPS